jgi:hypothetical protein
MMLQWGMSFAENLVCFGWGFLVPGVGGGLSQMAQAAVSGLSSILQSAIQGIQFLIQHEVEKAQAVANERYSNEAEPSTGELRLEMSYTHGLCGSIGKFSEHFTVYYLEALQNLRPHELKFVSYHKSYADVEVYHRWRR